MRIGLGAAALISLGLLTVGSASADARHYDCTKPGNANKAACKTPAGAPTPAAAPTIAAAPGSVAKPTTKAERHYDCSKAGNANKAACKAAAPAATPASAPAPAMRAPVPAMRTSAPAATAPAPRPAPTTAPASGSPRVVAWTEKNGKVVHYDCSKAGNFNKKACKQ